MTKVMLLPKKRFKTMNELFDDKDFKKIIIFITIYSTIRDNHIKENVENFIKKFHKNFTPDLIKELSLKLNGNNILKLLSNE